VEPKTQAIILGVSWFLVGGILYAGMAGVAILGGVGGVTSVPPAFEAMVGFIVCGLPFPMLFGWIPAAYRLAAGKKGPWVSAGIMGAIAIILPIVSFLILVNVR
jgi:hypothetical protein